MTDSYVHSFAAMGTVVSIRVVGHGDGYAAAAERKSAVERAADWFLRVEECCSRFDPGSELRALSDHVGEPVRVSDVLFETVHFALSVAEESGGAFDPTVGATIEAHGFDRDYRSGASVRSGTPADSGATYRDVVLDHRVRTITLKRPLLLDLSAVAKGLAVDLAAHELESFVNFAIDAGGDLYLAGQNDRGEPWAVGIRDPRDGRELVDTVRVSGAAVCTSGDYERVSPVGDGSHHIIDPRAPANSDAAEGMSVAPAGPGGGASSVTVIAPSTVVADALATAAFVLGPRAGIELLERHGVDGLILTTSGGRFMTQGMPRALDDRERTATADSRA